MVTDKNNPGLEVNQLIHGFRIKKIDALPLLRNVMYQLEHEETGALMVHLSNEDDNNCFGVAFRTTPTDSTGVAHILEHTALCGSKEFPVRDPFFSMIRRSMKTFMNAFTASDWTMYPFSTQNRKDFFNLMKVYLDAAFFPLLSEMSFKQEGHRLEFSDPDSADSPLTIQGVVYNEMKGAMSSQSQTMHDVTGRSLFPTITYKYNSGGDPSDIIELTHKQLVDFHQIHYHPSNSFFYTYGDLPLKDNLEFINDHTLAKFKKIQVNTQVPDETRFKTPKTFTYTYPLNEQDNDGKRCQVALTWLTCKIDEPLEILSLQLINLILLGHSGAPLRKKLIESGLGKSLADTTGFEDEIREAFFSVGLQAVAEDDVDKVESLITTTLEQVLKQGITQDQIESAIHQMEFDTKEISGGHYPYSLNLLFRFFGTWVHGGNPISAINFDNTLEILKEKIKKGSFLEDQIRKYLIDNPHRVKVILKPDSKLEQQRDQNLQTLLATRYSNLTEKEKQNLIAEARKLKAIQEAKEDLSCLPSLKISDIPKEIRYVDPVKTGLNNYDVAFYDRPTNGILYLNWYFKMDNISEEDRVWLPLFSNLLMNTGAGKYSYEEMAEQMSRFTGGFSSSPNCERIFNKANDYDEYYVISSKALNRNLPALFDITNLLLGPREFNELDRIQNLIAQRTNNLINSIVQVGHNYAASLANRHFSRASYFEELYGGIHQIQNMKGLLSKSKDEIKEITFYFRSLLKRVLNKETLSVLVVGDEIALKESEKHIGEFITNYNHSSLESSEIDTVLPPPVQLPNMATSSHPEAWCTTTPISYVAKAFKTIDYIHEDSPNLFVLSYLLKSCFLHGEIREKGGAYGAMTSYNTDDGLFNMISYRDPNLVKTTNIYQKALDWLQKGKFTEDDVNESILQGCSAMDTPASPASKAAVEYLYKRKGKTKKLREGFRAGVLSCKKEDLIRVGLEHLNAQTSIAAITSIPILERDSVLMKDNPFESFDI
ncbi:insulinase family protein [bacterium]|nr:insulinase family protein [bacterium]